MADEVLSMQESSAIRSGLEALSHGSITFTRPSFLRRYIAERAPRLSKDLQPPAALKEALAQSAPRAENQAYSPPRPPRPRTWDVGLSDDFAKTIDELGGKLGARVLKAIRDIARDPMTPKGDTIKPLTADLKGCWRYRVGDFRLVYQPDPINKRVAILAFASRGDIYS